jgi:tetratricopeptide (TPR) repeat protein
MLSRCFLLITIILCCFYTVAFGQGHIIRGKVRRPSGLSQSQVTVSLESGNGALINQTVTNNEGDFVFANLSDNSYVITISAPDYNLVSERVEFVRSVNANEQGETRTIEITLNAKTSPSRRAGVRFMQAVPKAALDAFTQATKMLGDGRVEEARTSLEAALKIFPDYFDARFLLAAELVKKGKLDDAIKQLNEAQRINPKDDRVWYVFGTLLVQQRKYAVAARVFGEAANLNPLDPQHFFMQGVALIDQSGNSQPKAKETADTRNYFLAEAEKALLRAYEVSGKKLALVHLQLARVYERKGDRKRAAGELEQYLKSPEAKDSAAIRDAIRKLREPEK